MVLVSAMGKCAKIALSTTLKILVTRKQMLATISLRHFAVIHKLKLAARKRTFATYRLPVAQVAPKSFFAISSVSATDISSTGPNSVPPPSSVPATWK